MLWAIHRLSPSYSARQCVFNGGEQWSQGNVLCYDGSHGCRRDTSVRGVIVPHFGSHPFYSAEILVGQQDGCRHLVIHACVYPKEPASSSRVLGLQYWVFREVQQVIFEASTRRGEEMIVLEVMFYVV